jgi:hypothetical protein
MISTETCVTFLIRTFLSSFPSFLTRLWEIRIKLIPYNCLAKGKKMTHPSLRKKSRIPLHMHLLQMDWSILKNRFICALGKKLEENISQ